MAYLRWMLNFPMPGSGAGGDLDNWLWEDGDEILWEDGTEIDPTGFSGQTKVTAVVPTSEVALNQAGLARRGDVADFVYSVTQEMPIYIGAPQSTEATPVVDPMTTGTSVLLTGMVMPHSVDSTFNWQAEVPVPDNLPSSPSFEMYAMMKAQGAEASKEVLLTLSYASKADGEDIDVALSGEGEATLGIGGTDDTLIEYSVTMDAAAIAAGDFVFGQFFRNGNAAGDTLTQDIQIFGMVIRIEGT